MATLKTQYENYLKENPGVSITYDEWETQIWSPKISDNFQIGPDGAFEYEDEDVSVWDVTLMDGLEEEDFIWEDSTIKTEVIDEECNWGRHGKLFLFGNKVVFDTSDGEYGPVAFDIKTLVTALKKHRELFNDLMAKAHKIVEERELTLEERYNLWFDNNYETGMERNFNPNDLPDFDDPYYEPTPTKLITEICNGEKIEIYL